MYKSPAARHLLGAPYPQFDRLPSAIPAGTVSSFLSFIVKAFVRGIRSLIDNHISIKVLPFKPCLPPASAIPAGCASNIVLKSEKSPEENPEENYRRQSHYCQNLHQRCNLP